MEKSFDINDLPEVFPGFKTVSEAAGHEDVEGNEDDEDVEDDDDDVNSKDNDDKHRVCVSTGKAQFAGLKSGINGALNFLIKTVKIIFQPPDTNVETRRLSYLLHSFSAHFSPLNNRQPCLSLSLSLS